MGDSLGPWVPLSSTEVDELLAGLPVRWWVAGGTALELDLGRSWRAHADVDIGICRVDAGRFVGHLAARPDGWEVAIAAAGALHPWDGHELDPDDHENNLWCRRVGEPWVLDVLVGEGDAEGWVYRRDPSFRLPWERVLRSTPDGTAYLAPALQLLFKSTSPRPRDDLDAQVVIPELDAEQLSVLDVRLPAEHAWRALVARHRRPFAAADVVRVIEVLDSAGVTAWLDGGWAVDALLAGETRPHADLDLAVATRSFAAALAALRARDFVEVRDDGPYNRVVVDRRGCRVDVHAFDDTQTVLDAAGVRRCGPDGLAYEADGFGGIGTVAGREMRCIDAATLVRYHSGYAVDDDDWHDVRQLCERFGVPVPADYARWRDG